MEKITVIVIAILFVVVSAIGIVSNAGEPATPKQFGPKEPSVQIQEWKVNRDRAKAESVIKDGQYMTETNNGEFIISESATVSHAKGAVLLENVSYPQKMKSLSIPFGRLYVLYIKLAK